MYYIYNINSMGCKHYLSNPTYTDCTLWTGADKELRAVFTDIEQAQQKLEQLAHYNRWSSATYYLEKVGN